MTMDSTMDASSPSEMLSSTVSKNEPAHMTKSVVLAFQYAHASRNCTNSPSNAMRMIDASVASGRCSNDGASTSSVICSMVNALIG